MNIDQALRHLALCPDCNSELDEMIDDKYYLCPKCSVPVHWTTCNWRREKIKAEHGEPT